MSQRYYEDVTVDEEIDSIEWTPTVEMAAGFTAAGGAGGGTAGGPPGTNRFTDEAAGRAIGVQGALVPGILKLAWLTRIVSEWAGPAAEVSNIRVAFRRPDVAGKPLVLAGRVVDKRMDGAQPIVELEVVTLADGQPSVRANVQVRMPSKG